MSATRERCRTSTVMLIVVVACTTASSCGDSASRNPSDAGASTDAGAQPDAGPTLTCVEPALQSPPCCYERSGAGRDEIELVFRSMGFSAPYATANVVFEAQIQSAFDEGRVPWLFDVREDAGRLVARTGFGTRDSAGGTYAFADTGAPGPGSPERWRPVSMTAHLDGERLETDATNDVLLLPLIGAGDPAPELRFRQVRFAEVRLAQERSCVGSRTPSRRWTYGDPPSRIEAYMRVDDADATLIPAIGNVSFCSFLASSACDLPRSGWDADHLPDARCEDDGSCSHGTDVCVRDGEDPTTQCNAWWFDVSFAAAAVEIAP